MKQNGLHGQYTNELVQSASLAVDTQSLAKLGAVLNLVSAGAMILWLDTMTSSARLHCHILET